ncbi:hypothetical protein DYB32_007108 [Aphanomyces invadans]|uniref:DDE-1 domain-containing protein n=1 Tax=Aphanomyces invadans TaxID=157072 RepID=A0A3R6VTZ7_9STRA|nr:hypothetical protein DYB32_007108 [Aphanomyces invadans]
MVGLSIRKDHILRLAKTARTSNQKCVVLSGLEPRCQLKMKLNWPDGQQLTWGLPKTEDEFKAGWHRIHGFKRRHGLSFRAKTRIGQDTNKDGTSILAAFSERVLLSAVVNDVGVIYNADQTGVNYKYMPTKTLNPTKDNTVWGKCGGKTKDRASAMLLAVTTGKKHTLFLVMKTSKSTKKDMLAFLKYHFAEREGRDTKTVILLWDDFSAHFTDDVVAYAESINVFFERVPPRFTWCCQPADVAWIRPLKFSLRERWLVEIHRQVRNCPAANDSLKLQGPSRSTMVAWITGAWNVLPEAVILNSFRKCQLLDGAVVDQVDVVESALEENDIADLAANMAIEDTIDPPHDINDDDVSELVIL